MAIGSNQQQAVLELMSRSTYQENGEKVFEFHDFTFFNCYKANMKCTFIANL